MTIQNSPSDSILVLGAGELGACVLRELAKFRDAGQVGAVSVLLRPDAGATSSHRADTVAMLGALQISIVEADLAVDSEEDLAAIFSGFDQIICCTGFVGGLGTQRKITAAVLAAGVAHYIPWQFGVDYDVVGRGSGQDVWDEQLDVRDMLRGQDSVRWTIVSTGMFTSFVVLPAFGLVDLERGVVRALGEWDYELTVTTPEDIGRLNAFVAANRREFEDKIVHVAGDTFTYSELADTLEVVLGRSFKRERLSVPQLRADVAEQPNDVMRKYRLAFARKDGVAWPKDQTLNSKLGMTVIDLKTWLSEWNARISVTRKSTVTGNR
ncbi:2'-hydroxyisoflavone reductase [Pandoraea pneumonica]|uniref:2'-hydroxyisoflavone reductase n=1 Tax=Pandoraea pneumonica TaxID=2508299 RepID=A0A5E4RPL2_9BURK|nr:aromatic alcohol reductase [Pandoraea pneumonica]VVD64701.1 2'-hydroxyisoflavone reductase [Pandoraea pneumonica]